MNRGIKAGIVAAVTLLAMVAGGRAQAAVSLGIDAGTLGAGPELQFTLGDTLNARVGFAAYSYDRDVTDTGVTYHGKLKLSNGLALLEWHPGGHSFKVSFGAVATGNKVDITGVPTSGSYQIGNGTYPASDFASVQGTVKAGNGVAPYLGVGFGNPLGEGSHLTLLFDLGVIYTGAPKASLSASCSASVPAATCAQIQQDAAVEINKLQNQYTQLKIWPVVNLGLAYRF
jgi:hypothetical protein